MLTKDELEKLNTKRLLAYFKSQRKQLFTYRAEWDDCYLDIDDRDSIEQGLQDHYDLIKEILAKRENIK